MPNAPVPPSLHPQARSVQRWPAPLCPACPRALRPTEPRLLASSRIPSHRTRRVCLTGSGTAAGSDAPAETPSDRFPSKASALHEQAPTGDCAQKTHSPCLVVYSNSDGNFNTGKTSGVMLRMMRCGMAPSKGSRIVPWGQHS